MEKTNIFQLIHNVELYTNEAIIRWSKSFKHNIGISPILVLGDLKQNGPQQQSVLANKLGYTPGAMTNIANRLIKNGCVERKYNDNDRRHVLLEVTEKGLTVLADAQKKGQELRLALFQELSDEELKQFMNISEKLLKAFK